MPANAQPIEWLPVSKALAAAKPAGRLVLLYVRGGTLGDKKNDEWIAHMDSHEALKDLLGDVVVATAATYRDRRSPALLILDPGGEVIHDLGFHEYGVLAATLAQLRRQAPLFARGAAARDAGRIAESLLLRGNGLLYAGVVRTPEDLLTKALELARADHNEVIVQEAAISLASIAANDGDSGYAVELLNEVIAKPANNDIAARAWIVLGHQRKLAGDKPGAVDAYQNAWRVAAKPSPPADAARRFLEMIGSAPESDVQAAVAAGGVRLLYPHRAVLAGVVEVSAVVPASAARVEFYLDGARIAERTRAPFVARIPLGALPRVRTIKAVAFDARDTPLGEDSATLNERSNALAVEIVAPRDSSVESKTVIEVQPRVPQGSRLDAIDLYWNEQKLATLTAPPFRHELTLPSKGAFGYIRVVARDASGATAEDAKLINGEGAAEVVRVDAVELFAIVQDRHGRNIAGLTSKDFVVKEDGVPVSVAVHGSADEPITVGIAVDASGSMRDAMSSVMDYATEFLRHSLGEGDQTFVVSFAESPSLYQPLTADREHVSASIFDMRAYGATALWDAVIFSLDQIRAVPGKRALLLFTDGDDTGSRAAPAAALQYAHEVGVPVYVVMVYTGSRASFNVTSGYGSVQMPASVTLDQNIRRLGEGTGGAFIRFPRQKDLPKLFQQVRDDTRGAYTLTFVSRSARKRTEPRKIFVAVPGRRGLVVRAPSAYYPR
ncbi:MAG: VWA domain-containing protein [Acidobacteriota bacterium]